MNMVPIGAINDGCLQIQIQIPDPVNGGRMFWSRQYYVVPLKVSSPSFSPVPVVLCSFAMFQADGIVGKTVLSREWEGEESYGGIHGFQGSCVRGAHICGDAGGHMSPGVLSVF
jgi:hypothetical protein